MFVSPDDMRFSDSEDKLCEERARRLVGATLLTRFLKSSEGELVAQTTQTAYQYEGLDEGYYGVSAFDINGNESVISKILITATDLSNELLHIPDDFILNNCYPNPFNPSTIIQYGLPELSRVKISVYDIRGQQVSTIVDGIMSPGYHEVEWRPRLLSNGYYFIRMEADHFTQVQKVTLLK